MSQTFNCPACTAPLDYPGGKTFTIRCPYCNSTVIVPERLQRPPAITTAVKKAATPSTRPVASGSRASASGMPRSRAELQAALAEIELLARAGDKTAALKQYREKFGAGQRDAWRVVDLLAEGNLEAAVQRAIESAEYTDTPAPPPDFAPHLAQRPPTKASFLSRIGPSLAVFLFFFLTVVLPIGAAVLAEIDERTHWVSIWGGNLNPWAQARATLALGEEGTGPGRFSRPDLVTADGEGYIYMTNRTDSRIQRFDPEGNYVSSWVVNPDTVVDGLAARTDGAVFVAQDDKIYRYDGATGNLLAELDAGGHANVEHLVVTAEGGLIALLWDDSWLRFDADGRLRQTVPNRVADENGSLDHIAVDGLGNIYALGDFRQRTGSTDVVYIFAPDGRFVTRFGSNGEEPGQFRSPGAIAVDGKQQVYVSDSGGMKVFDGNGRYLYTINRLGHTRDMEINGRNELIFVHSYFNKIIRYQLRD